MKTLHSLCLVFLFLASIAYTETCVDDTLPQQTLNFDNGYKGDFVFSPTGIKTKVTVQMMGDCKVTVTRKCATAGEILDRCSSTSVTDYFPELEEQAAAGIIQSRYSIYQIEHESCTDLSFPAEVYISYYGMASEVGTSKAYRLRMIHAPEYSRECTDVTYSVDASANDPKGGGGEDGYSDFFLVNVYGSSLPELSTIWNQITELELDSEPEFDNANVKQAFANYNKMIKHIKEKDSVNARAEKEKTKSELKNFYDKVKRDRVAANARKGSKLMKRAQRLQFQIEQAGLLKIPK